MQRLRELREALDAELGSPPDIAPDLELSAKFSACSPCRSCHSPWLLCSLAFYSFMFEFMFDIVSCIYAIGVAFRIITKSLFEAKLPCTHGSHRRVITMIARSSHEDMMCMLYRMPPG